MNDVRDRVFEILTGEIPGLTKFDIDKPLETLSIDSFGLVSLRARIELAIGTEIPDRKWTEIRTPNDILGLTNDGPESVSFSRSDLLKSRSYNLNMPQMALSGLSESWLFKEIGDYHWGLITDGLGASSSDLNDGEGERLYATFTRISISLDRPLRAFKENEKIVLTGGISRFGSGIFISNSKFGNGEVTALSSFSRRGEAGSNTTLLKGQPEIPENCDIPQLMEPPAFASEYRSRRSQKPERTLFECDYEILPHYDINGVGLLYFAAYPMIADICDMRHHGRHRAFDYSTKKRDVFYFKNSNPNDTLVYREHKYVDDGKQTESECSISRKSDGELMAYICTIKEMVND